MDHLRIDGTGFLSRPPRRRQVRRHGQIVEVDGGQLMPWPRLRPQRLTGRDMLHLLALTRTALLVRHWFEIDLDDASMEHGCRVELREVPALPHRGTESAAQVVTADRPLWRADLFDRVGDPPGSFSVAHYHPRFNGVEPCDRVWDDHLTSDPWGWLEKRLRDAGAASASWPTLDADDAAELVERAPDVVAIAQQFSPARCTSTAQCYRQTRDVRGAVQLMVHNLKDPEALDRAAVSSWTEN